MQKEKEKENLEKIVGFRVDKKTNDLLIELSRKNKMKPSQLLRELVKNSNSMELKK